MYLMLDGMYDTWWAGVEHECTRCLAYFMLTEDDVPENRHETAKDANEIRVDCGWCGRPQLIFRPLSRKEWERRAPNAYSGDDPH